MGWIDRPQCGICRSDDAMLRGMTNTQTCMVVLKVGQTQDNIPNFDNVVSIEGCREQTVIGVILDEIQSS